MHEFQAFYDSRAWKECRAGYLKSVGGLCENCMKRGLYNPARVVHHKIHISELTVDDPAVALNWQNLEALCQDCHAEAHRDDSQRFTVAANGEIVAPPVRESGGLRGLSSRLLPKCSDNAGRGCENGR